MMYESLPKNKVGLDKKLPLVEAGIQYKKHKHQADYDMNNKKLD